MSWALSAISQYVLDFQNVLQLNRVYCSVSACMSTHHDNVTLAW